MERQHGPQRTKLSAATQVRFTPGQLRALELVAEQRGVGISTAARELVAEALSHYTDEAGVTLLEAVEAEMLQESITAKRMAHFFGDRGAQASDAR